VQRPTARRPTVTSADLRFVAALLSFRYGTSDTSSAARCRVQTRAILAVLGKRLLDSLKEMTMDVNKIPETKASREFRLFFENRGREEGLVEGKRASVLAVLAARGLSLSSAEQEEVTALTDSDVLGQLLQCAVTAATLEEALAPLRSRPARVRGARPRTASGSSPRAAANGKRANGHQR
jgi:hypothetical protein